MAEASQSPPDESLETLPPDPPGQESEPLAPVGKVMEIQPLQENSQPLVTNDSNPTLSNVDSITLGFHDISTFREIPEWSTSYAKAFHAFDKRAPDKPLLAFVSVTEFGWDEAQLEALLEVSAPWTLRVRAYEIVYWPPDDRYWPMVITDRPEARPLWISLQVANKPIPEDKLTANFIAPMTRLLRNLEQEGNVYGALNPMNICLPSSGSQYLLRLPCLSPPGVQASQFEPLYRAMCVPTARGASTLQADMFGLGVTILSLMNGAVPGSNMDEAALLKKRAEDSSLVALTQETNCSQRMLDCLSGLLHDDDDDRWDINNLWMWLNGWKQRSPSSKAASIDLQSGEAITINDKACFHVRSAIWQMSTMKDKAADLIESNKMERWIKQGFTGTNLPGRYDGVLTRPLISKTIDRKEWAVSACMCLLDLRSPLFAKGRFYARDGVMTALADTFIEGHSTDDFVFLFSSHLSSIRLKLLFENTPQKSLDITKEIAQLRRMEESIASSKDHSLLLYLLYKKNHYFPCLNQYIRSHYVTTPRSFMLALEKKLSQSPPLLEEVFDQHTCAFLDAHDTEAKDKESNTLTPPTNTASFIELLTALAKFQTLNRLARLPVTCRWLTENMNIVLNSIQNRRRRESTLAKLAQTASLGSIRMILNIVRDPSIINDDKREFIIAKAEYQALHKRVETVEKFIESDESKELFEHHYQASALIGGILAIVMIFVLLLWIT